MEASFTFRNARDTKRNLFFTSNLLGNYKIYQLNEQSLCSFTHVPINATYTAILTMLNNTIWVFDQAAIAWYCWKSTSAVPEKLLLDKESMKTEEVTDAKFLGRLYLANYRLPWFVTI